MISICDYAILLDIFGLFGIIRDFAREVVVISILLDKIQFLFILKILLKSLKIFTLLKISCLDFSNFILFDYFLI